MLYAIYVARVTTVEIGDKNKFQCKGLHKEARADTMAIATYVLKHLV